MALIKGILAKEGKGVEKNANDGKSAFMLFLELYGRKLWKTIQVGLIYLIVALPTLAVWWLCSGLISNHVVNLAGPVLAQIVENADIALSYTAIVDFFVRAFIALLFMSLWGVGPVSAGFTYIMRNYAREEYAWPWSDFLEHTKKNFFQALCVWVIDVIVFVLLIFSFLFYSTESGSMSLLKYVIAFVFLTYTTMHFYIYQLMITFKLKIKDIFKNAFLLAIVALPANMLVFVLTIVFHGIFPYLGLNFSFFGGSMGFWTIYILFALLILQGLSGFMINFVANRTIKKYMLDRLGVKEEN